MAVSMSAFVSVIAAGLLIVAPSAAASPAMVYASARADAWLPEFMVERQPAPVDGRRVQIVASILTNVADADLGSVSVGGTECLNLPSDGTADISVFSWCRAHTTQPPIPNESV